ncbi:C40 family peptidase [Paenibacillus eucommiae]|uniref:Cell wall-associated NlpC family hydrolase n=1 Tax=Paenibacillus eucommiae TaxID=1355755 RepID=A0ABS4INM4_9BACL|nr:C40 family peptidase [Paenibacillus eucommiae]MBP1989166.1 cell wall-associated NlpC family hydrolase [Paenibacillus eucommiae]
MSKHNVCKQTIIGLGCLSLLWSSALLTQPTTTAAAASQTQVQAQASSLSSAQKATKIVNLAQSLKGKVTYKYGVNNSVKYIFDCSSFTKYLFASQGITLKWGSNLQSKQGTYVAKKNLKKGDLVFFGTSLSNLTHVGVYMGNGKYIHNTIGKNINGVLISDLSASKKYITARRVLN